MDERWLDSAKRILSYFIRNPTATDTCEGIARWRLLEQAIHQTTEETAQAIGWLESRGFLKRVGRTGSTPLFMLDSSHSAEAAEFLADAKLRRPTPIDEQVMAKEKPRGEEN